VIRIQVDDVEKAIENLKKSIDTLAKTKIAIGVFANAGTNDRGVPIAEYAAYQELGTVSIPARSFLLWSSYLHRDDESAYVEGAADGIVGQMLSGEVDPMIVAAGARWVGYVQSTIDSGGGGRWVPLAPSTIAKKGHDIPLIDKERLYKAITYEVR
jgi:hypothetical protein